MSFAGHVSDMNNRLKQNREALNSKKAKFREKKFTVSAARGEVTSIKEIELTKDELEQIKQEIRQQAKAERVARWLKIAIGSAVAIALFVILVVGLEKLL